MFTCKSQRQLFNQRFHNSGVRQSLRIKSLIPILVKALLPVAIGLASMTGNTAEDIAQAPELESVIVMGERLGRDLQQTVTSVRVFDEEDIAKLNAHTVVDLLNKSANLVATDTSFTIRGIRNSGVGGAGSSDTATIFVDGVPVTSSNTTRATLGIWDVSQVEVLRGAQSTNQGANTLAGAIVIRTNDPTFDGAEGKVRLRAGQYGIQEQAFAYGDTLIDDVLSYRVSVQRYQDDGFITNQTLDDDEWGGADELNGRAKLLWQPSGNDDTQVLLTLSRQETDSNVFNIVRSDDPFERDSFENTPTDIDISLNKQATLEMTHRLNDQWELKSITSAGKYRFDYSFDEDRIAQLDTVRDVVRDQNVLTQELRLSFDSERLRAVAGLYASKVDDFSSNDTKGRFIDIDGPGPFPSIPLGLSNSFDQTNTNYAFYFDSDYDLTDWLVLNLGGRLDRTEVETATSVIATRDTDLSLLGLDATCAAAAPGFGSSASDCNQLVDGLLPPADGGEGGASDTVFLPKFGLTASVSDDINLGFSVQRAFRSAGASLNQATSQVVPFNPEFSTNYELSLRSQWFEQALTVNANVFYVDWKDQQVTVTNPLNNSDQQTENAGKSALQGAELEAYWQLTEALDIYAALGYVDTEFKEFVSFGEDYSGNEFPYASSTTASIGINWSGTQGMFGSVNARYAAENYSSIENKTNAQSDAYTVFDVRVGYRAQNWQVSAYVDNLFDREYLTDRDIRSVSGIEYNRFIVGSPRVAGLSLDLFW